MKLKSTHIILAIVVVTLSVVGLVIGIPLVQASTSSTTSSSSQIYEGREITSAPPIIHDVSGSFKVIGSTTDFSSAAQHFQVLTQANDQFDIYWEHNATYLHVLVDTVSQGYVAIGWRSSSPIAPNSELANNPIVMDGASIVIGQAFPNGSYTIRNDFGISWNHYPNYFLSKNVTVGGKNMTVYGQEFVNQTGNGIVKQVTENGQIHTVMEFVMPLEVANPYNITTLYQNYSPYVNLTTGSYAYFLVSSYTQSNTYFNVTYNGKNIDYPMMMYHGQDRMIISRPVYIQKTTESYPTYLSDSQYIIQKYYPPTDPFTILINEIQANLANLIANGGLSNAVIPLTGTFFFVLFIIIGPIVIIYYAIRKHWNLTSTLIPIVIIAVFALTVISFPLPVIYQPLTCVAPDTHNPICSEVGVQVIVEAHIKPWNFNITVYQNDAINTSLNGNWADPTEAYSSFSYASAQNMMNASNYLTDLSYGGKVIWNYTVYTNQVVHMILQAQDTEHGFTIYDSSGTTYTDLYTHNQIYLTLPQHNPQNVYFQAPATPQILTYQCIFYCGAGHFTMKGNIIVLQAPS